jgi:hypothetical protein
MALDREHERLPWVVDQDVEEVLRPDLGTWVSLLLPPAILWLVVGGALAWVWAFNRGQAESIGSNTVVTIELPTTAAVEPGASRNRPSLPTPRVGRLEQLRGPQSESVASGLQTSAATAPRLRPTSKGGQGNRGATERSSRPLRYKGSGSTEELALERPVKGRLLEGSAASTSSPSMDVGAPDGDIDRFTIEFPKIADQMRAVLDLFHADFYVVIDDVAVAKAEWGSRWRFGSVGNRPVGGIHRELTFDEASRIGLAEAADEHGYAGARFQYAINNTQPVLAAIGRSRNHPTVVCRAFGGTQPGLTCE